MRPLSLLLLTVLLAACRGPEQAREIAARGPQVLRSVTLRSTPPLDVSLPLRMIAETFNGQAGIAVMDVSEGWTASWQGERVFPQQSVAKLWVALAVLDQVDRGQLRLDQTVFVRPADLSIFSQPIAREVRPYGLQTDVRDLLHRALVQSDNAADDMLIEVAGGVPAVQQIIAGKGLGAITVGDDQRQLQSRIAGLTWRPEYAGNSRAFRDDRVRVPEAMRQARLEEYLAAPPDGATPVQTVRALARLAQGQLLSPASTAVMLDDMRAARTGARRLRGALAPGWSLAHKTGTGPDFHDESVGINDVGLLTAPDGHLYAVAVYVARTRAPIPDRLTMMQSVTQTIINHWNAQHPGFAPLTPAAPDKSATPADVSEELG